VLHVSLSQDGQLRLLEESDAEELHALIDAERAHLSQWMPWPQSQTLEGTREFIRLGRRQFTDNTGLQAAIVRGGEIAGVIGFHAVSRAHRSANIGYWIAQRHQGRGTVTAAVRALLEHAFTVWNLNRVEIRTAPDNTRSKAIPERLGFTVEGTLRQAERIGERYLDSVVFSMLASEWDPGSQP
jgi:ribosomal-protein-serine acetyltransferase